MYAGSIHIYTPLDFDWGKQTLSIATLHDPDNFSRFIYIQQSFHTALVWITTHSSLLKFYNFFKFLQLSLYFRFLVMESKRY